jgi:hypothetical protein
MFSCPNCDHLASEYPDAGVSVVICAQCTYKYELSAGSVTSFTSNSVEVRPPAEGRRATYARRFELKIAVSPRETVRFMFGTERDDEWIALARGDRAVVVYAMRGKKREQLLCVVNRTSGERFLLGTPNTRSKNMAALTGLAAAGASAIAAVALSVPGPLVVLGVMVIGFGTSIGLRRFFRPEHVLTSNERAELSARQTLLREKRDLLRLRENVIGDVEIRAALRERLRNLHDRMVAVQLDAYAARIGLIDEALETLDAQLAVDHQLVAEYTRTLQIIDIEYESSVAADVLPADGARIMESRLAELRAVEEHRAETTRRLSANAEVELLLRSHSG